jgi:hypothetical protein
LDLPDFDFAVFFVFLPLLVTELESEDFFTPNALAQFAEYWFVAPERKIVIVISHKNH